MNISGIGFHMTTGTLNGRDRSYQGFGRYDIANQYHPLRADDMEDVSKKEMSFHVSKALHDLKRDKTLEEFQVFVRSGEEPFRQYHRENQVRFAEDFAMSV